jgi:hypothetical protein
MHWTHTLRRVQRLLRKTRRSLTLLLERMGKGILSLCADEALNFLIKYLTLNESFIASAQSCPFDGEVYVLKSRIRENITFESYEFVGDYLMINEFSLELFFAKF